MSSKVVHVAIIGAGGVGKCFINQLSAFAAKSSVTLKTILLSRSKTALVSRDYSGINLSTWESDFASSAVATPAFPAETLDFLKSAPGPVILVDNTSNESVAAAYPQFLNAGIHIVTPNKKGFSSGIQLWNDIFAAAKNGGNPNGGYVFHEASCGAGLPVISTIKELVETGDVIKKIEGVFSGTMSFLFNNYAPLDGKGTMGFADAVKFAKDEGYTEPDPRDDLNGADVARKLTILARLSGLQVEDITKFPIQSLVPADLESAKDGDEYLAKLPGHKSNDDIAEKKAAAEAQGGVIRYVGSIDFSAGSEVVDKVSVGLRTFDKTSPIAGLQGADNIISITTERYNKTPLVIQGAGAGGDVTAMGVLGDLIKVLQRI